MTYDEIIAHYHGHPSDAARAVGEDRRLIHSWKGRRVPSKHQIRYELLTAGVLIADPQARREAEEMAQLVRIPDEARAS